MIYPAAPIIEAIFDIRIDSLADSSIEKIEALHNLVIEHFPNKKKQINIVGKIELSFDNKVSKETNSQFLGVIFSNKDDTRKIQFRINGFTYNMMKPYTDWDTFSTDAFSFWKIYNDNLTPKNIIRIALRYINKIEIPLPFNGFQEYIINMPPIPSCLPQSFNNFFMQTEIPCDESGTNLIITETFEPPSNILPFILDIDAYKIGNINNDRANLIKEFNYLRNLKNKTFESCITDNTRKLFSNL